MMSNLAEMTLTLAGRDLDPNSRQNHCSKPNKIEQENN